MKVLTENRLAPWTKEVTCVGPVDPAKKPGCGSKLQVTASDLRRVVDHTSRKKPGTSVAVFVCPLEHCGVETDLKESDMPPWVFAGLETGVPRGGPDYYD